MFFTLFLLSWFVMDIYSEMIVKDVPVAIVDFDNSSISRTIRQFVNSTRTATVKYMDILSLEDAEELFKDGVVSAIILIPDSFSSDIKKGKHAYVTIAVDQANILLGKNVYKDIAQAIGTVSAGVQLTYLKKKGVAADNALARVVPIVVDENFSFNPANNYVIYICPGILMFLFHVFFLILVTSTWLPGTSEDKLVKRLGSLLAVFAVCVPVALVLFYVFLPYVEIYPKSSFGVVLTLLMTFMLFDIFMALAFFTLIPSKLTALQVTIVFGMLSMMLSGITWPTNMFPYWMQVGSILTPFTPFAKAFQTFLHYPTQLSEIPFVWEMFLKEAIAFGFIILLGLAARFGISKLKGGSEC